MQLKPTLPIWISVLTLSTMLMSGCGKSDQQNAPQIAPQKVGVVILKAETYTLTKDFPGRTSSHRVAEVRPQVDGIILKRIFTEGGEVKEGDQLYQIDPAIYQAEVNSAYANLTAAQALEKRYKLLVKNKAVSQQQYDDAYAALLQAKASLQTAEVRLKYTKVLAPISGRISRSLVTEGALVTAGQPSAMTNIYQLDPIYVDVTQPSKDILRLRQEFASGQLEKVDEKAAKATLILEDGTEYAHEGRLEFSEVSVNETTGSVTLRAIFPNPNHELLTGMYVRARLKEGMRDNAILAPQLGVTHNIKGQAVAMVVGKDNKVEQRILKVSRIANDDYWLVDEGLNAGDQLIVKGLQYIQPGTSVEVLDESKEQTNNSQNVGK